MHDDYTQKEIADKVGVSENTMSAWVNDGNWDDMRKSQNTTNATIIRDLQKALDAMRKEAVKFAEDDDPATKPDTDGIYKMALAIQKLQNKTQVGDIIRVIRDLIKFVRTEDLELAKQITHWGDLFIQSSLKAN